MITDYKKWLKISAFAALMGFAPEMFAQAVIFPQVDQPGIANVENVGEKFTISNDLLSATFSKVGNQLKFDGCKEMSLLPSDDIFKIQINNGEDVLSSQMTLVSVNVEDLAGDPNAVKGVLRFPGKAIVAKYTYKKGNTHDLEVTWRAVLRDGSHYLRSVMDIKANKDSKMYSIIPLMVTVDNAGKKSPSVSGNTRGAVVLSDHLFAGLENPTGYNSSTSVDISDMNSFEAKKWTKTSFNWVPGLDTPAEMLKNGSKNDKNTALKPEEVIGARGGVVLEEDGDLTLTFDYKAGNQGLVITGVDVMNQQGAIVAKDYHVGFSGGAKQNHIYTLKGLKKGCYIFRYFSEIKSEDIRTGNDNTLGDIVFSKKIKPNRPNLNVVFDGPVAVAPAVATPHKSSRTLSKNTIGEDETLTDGWVTNDWKVMANPPLRIGELVGSTTTVKCIEQPLNITQKGTLSTEFQYKPGGGGNKLNLCGVDLIDEKGDVVVSEYHLGNTGDKNNNNIYTFEVPFAGNFKVRYFVYEPGEVVSSRGDITMKLSVIYDFHFPSYATSPITCKWSRNVNLVAGKSWNISAVIGLVAKDQARRSVAAYVERERAVPWRPYPIYNSWYELNINRNNAPAPEYKGNMTSEQCSNIVRQWKTNFFDKYHTGIKAFVWDDGWDTYGTWEFNPNFPNKFDEQDQLAKSMNSGIGCWLGPVGGYGTSGGYRRDYWNAKDENGQPRGGMRLSNPKYYEVFYKACHNLLVDYKYDFRYFKFDGISGSFSAVGPDPNNDEGNENAEAIINAELTMRDIKPDVFFNTSVGTWASPFWFRITDAVWRQEKDYSTIGNNNSDRENWITYRDRLVYQNFVQNSPMCPINNLMTHGFILTNPANASKDQNYNAVLREMRCAFACGSAMVELYNDYELMNKIQNNEGVAGALWADLAECIQWQEKNAPALADIHWVGGNPWTGAMAEIYGWAGWNGKNAVLTLRNGDNNAKTFKTTLREALDIPEFVKGTITFNKAWKVQDALEGFTEGTPIDIDAKLTLKLPGSSVFSFDNTQEADAIDAAKNKLKVAIEKAQSIVSLLGEGTGKYTCAGLTQQVVADAQAVYDNIYATQKMVDEKVASLDQVLAAAKLNKPTTGKFYRIKALNNNVEANATLLYLSSDLTEGKMNLVADATDAKTMFYLSQDNHLTACGAMLNVSAAGLAQDMGEAQQFAENKTQAGHYVLNDLVAQGTNVATVADATNLKNGAWQLIEVPAEQAYKLTVNVSNVGYSTLYAPVALTLPNNVQAFTGKINEAKELLQLTPVTTAVPAGTAVVLKASANEYQFNFAPTATETSETNDIKGSFVNLPTPSNNKIYTLQFIDNEVGFFLYSGNQLNAGKAYLELPKNVKVRGFKFVDGDLTGVEELVLSEKSEVYDLSGRKVLSPSKGLYIVNGKKVFVK